MNAKKLILPVLLLAFNAFSQGGYDIKISLKGSKDSVGYLATYGWDTKYVLDTCKNVKNGNYIFKGKKFSGQHKNELMTGRAGK